MSRRTAPEPTADAPTREPLQDEDAERMLAFIEHLIDKCTGTMSQLREWIKSDERDPARCKALCGEMCSVVEAARSRVPFSPRMVVQSPEHNMRCISLQNAAVTHGVDADSCITQVRDCVSHDQMEGAAIAAHLGGNLVANALAALADMARTIDQGLAADARAHIRDILGVPSPGQIITPRG